MASFREQIQAHAGAGGLLSRSQERALLRLGTAGYGLDFDRARGAMLDAAATESVVLESEVEEAVADYLRARTGPGGRVSRSVFESAVALYRSRARGLIGMEQAAGRVKDLMLRRGFVPRASGLVLRNRRWFNRIPRPVDDGLDAAASIAPVEAVVQAPVRETLNAWNAAFNAGDVQGILSLYAPDALLLATASPEPRRGPAAMRSYFENLMITEQGSVQFGATLAIHGNDPAAAGGLYTFSVIDPATGPGVIQARFTFVVTRDGAGPIGSIIQHHSSALPRPNGGPCPV